jgi:hypothetical protein
METKRKLLNHFLAALAYRTQKALRDAPEEFGSFRAIDGVRTPAELVRHMTSVLGYARTNFVGGHYRPEPLDSLAEEVERFLLQGPFSDAMTHAGQLALLRRLAGAPVPPENFIVAEIKPDRLGPDQARPVSPDKEWPEAPPGWKS